MCVYARLFSTKLTNRIAKQTHILIFILFFSFIRLKRQKPAALSGNVLVEWILANQIEHLHSSTHTLPSHIDTHEQEKTYIYIYLYNSIGMTVSNIKFSYSIVFARFTNKTLPLQPPPTKQFIQHFLCVQPRFNIFSSFIFRLALSFTLQNRFIWSIIIAVSSTRIPVDRMFIFFVYTHKYPHKLAHARIHLFKILNKIK